jgi:HIV Tat-specific factor 1
MDGRFFGGRQIVASLYDGRRRFRKTGGADDSIGGSEADEARRLDEFGKWLEEEDGQ